MKENELMIGDWIYSTFSEHPCKVKGIEWTESEYAYVNISGVDGYKCIESLSPIHLTPEILEKNGFKPYIPENHLETVYASRCIEGCSRRTVCFMAMSRWFILSLIKSEWKRYG